MWSPRNALGGVVGVAVGMGVSLSVSAADLPAHDPLRILVVSDEVNPHDLTDAQLTQPGDLEAALGDPGSGLNVEALAEVESQCIDDALAQLAEPGATDVVVYFAHLPAVGCDGSAQQEALTAGLQAHLQAGGGIVVFHHGIYEAAGKEAVLELLGGRASSVIWNTATGQDVIATAPEHFVAAQGVEYGAMRDFGGAGVDAGSYPFFNNTPDERYEAIVMLEQGGEDRTILFTSADGGGGAARVLGYDLHRPGWGGHVVFYQPGEYQPQALDLEGNNFQILANAIVYVARTEEDGGTTSGDGSTGGPSADTGGADDSGGAVSGDASAGDDAAATGGDTEAASAQGGDDGCGCRSGAGSGAAWWMLPLGLGISRRRRRRGPARARGSRPARSRGAADRPAGGADRRRR